MKLSWILVLLNFLTFMVVDADAGGGEVTTDANANIEGEQQATETNDEPDVTAETPESAVLDAIGLNEDGTKKDEADTDQAGEDPENATQAADEAAQKAEAEAGKKQEALTDADLAPLEGKNKDTNERFRKVTEGYKQEKERAETLQAQNQRYQESFNSLRQLGFADSTAAEDLVEFSSYRHVLATGDEKAFGQIISQQIRQFEMLHGKKVGVKASALDEFPDLKEQVDNLELDESVAIEVAHSRSLQQRAQREMQNRSQQQQVQNDHTQVLNQAVSQVEQMQATWQKSDPDYLAILPHLQPQLAEIGRNYAPALWPQLLELQYKSLKKALVEAKSNRGANLPLRGNGNLTGKPAPSSPQEAVLQELGLDGQ